MLQASIRSQCSGWEALCKVAIWDLPMCFIFSFHDWIYSLNLAFVTRQKVIMNLLFSISTVMTMLLMKDFFNYYCFFFFYKPLWILWPRSATRMFRGYFCSILADYFSLVWGEKSFYMRSKKAFSFSLNSPWQSSEFFSVWTFKVTVFWSSKGDDTWHSVSAGKLKDDDDHDENNVL